MLTSNELADFKAGLATLSSKPQYLQFLVYGVRPNNEADLSLPDLSMWPSTLEIHKYILGGEAAEWPITIHLFEIESPRLPSETEEALVYILDDLASQGSDLCWMMFEGTFGNISSLFNDWTIPRTYAIYFEGIAPILNLSFRKRQEQFWHNLLKQAEDHLYDKYPELKTISNS